MKRTLALLLAGVLCTNPLLAQDETKEGPSREQRRAQAMEKELKALREQLQRAQDELAATKDRMLASRRKAEKDAARAKAIAAEAQHNEAAIRADAEAALTDAHNASERAAAARLNQLTDMLAAVESRVGKEHAYAASLRKQLMAQAADLQAAGATLAAQYGPKHPKVLHLKEQIEAIKRKADVYSDPAEGQRDVMDRLRAELSKTRKDYGSNHSRVKQLAEQLKALEHDLADKQKGEYKRQMEDRMTALRDLELQIAESVHREQLGGYREKMAREREELQAKLKLTEKQRSKDLQEKRTQEMLLMQERLARATALAQGAGNQASAVQDSAMKMLDKRMGKVEQKLDRIADLLEKLLDK